MTVAVLPLNVRPHATPAALREPLRKLWEGEIDISPLAALAARDATDAAKVTAGGSDKAHSYSTSCGHSHVRKRSSKKP